MQVQVQHDEHIQGGESLVQWVQTETASRLARFRDHLTRVEVHLSDLDAGKSGGGDKRCVAEARLAGRQPIAVNADADKVADAFMAAVEKLARAIDTDLGRLKDKNGRETIRTATE
ncbi:ribosomal subunit Interface protein [Paracidovorax avenae]|uniref:Sigma 54 modulation protein/ribosomal protein S30EA n=1 Tax=Paracidovorax avenae (strain ATCC 19860 / DSM 7227 / CCUG 15838 / JCM 20985 / LMG 2117 / NCPPB 1011) TaxID=643561 RepID=F0QA41_PARA1|nr:MULTISPECIES: HPF/RaiA family ribosome-associated protein [Comamonadaceae]ADX48409.1 sigma 54 modulation protein/ribosomal protein S30EA [Paracidovorax avenae ATCC 19860]AVS68701.1 ribosomal subunit Interface protein [Paracidovorax avenae]AVS72207.1 ribosomal subunit Interface protein [Paracidovorax avenae]AVS79338.1 ribosomal subunit Interface protein [Paracidovorax avenae]AVS82821.1 ribosomal subunit Interface protein [Paracidovorax avenae]